MLRGVALRPESFDRAAPVLVVPAARALGLAFPPTFLARADEGIE
jgi:hypothetical protein